MATKFEYDHVRKAYQGRVGSIFPIPACSHMVGLLVSLGIQCNIWRIPHEPFSTPLIFCFRMLFLLCQILGKGSLRGSEIVSKNVLWRTLIPIVSANHRISVMSSYKAGNICSRFSKEALGGSGCFELSPLTLRIKPRYL